VKDLRRFSVKIHYLAGECFVMSKVMCNFAPLNVKLTAKKYKTNTKII